MSLNWIRRYAAWISLPLLLAAAIAYVVRGVAGVWFWGLMGPGLALMIWFLIERKGDLLEIARSRKARHGANALLFTLMVLVALAFAQAIIGNHSASFDLSKAKVHTLADETVKAFTNLEQDMKVLGFFAPGDGQQAQFEALLKKCRDINPKRFSYEFINLNKSPLLAEQYSVRSYGTTVLVAGERSESFGSANEESLVNALLKLSSSGSKVIYWLAGHQELSLMDFEGSGANQMQKAFESATFKVKELNLLRDQAVPADAAALFIVGPRRDLPGAELKLLKDYLARGGRLTVALDPRSAAQGFAHFLGELGFEIGHDIVVDPILRMFGGDPVAPIVSQFDGSHPVTREFRAGEHQMILPVAQSIDVKSIFPAGAMGTALLTSNPTAWAYRGTGNRLPSKPGAGDKPGPVKLAAAVEGPVTGLGGQGEAKWRVVVIGCSRIMSNQGLTLYNNQDFAVNSARWLADDIKRIAIAARKEESQPLMLDRARMSAIWLGGLLLSLGTLAIGGVVLWRRKRAL